ncbi:MAG: hypothetical protein OXE58_15790 [Acidobacteria bacterium]|nr:hypothetical protein [Acidobacteriota bacterium]
MSRSRRARRRLRARRPRPAPPPSRDERIRRAVARARERLDALQPVPGSEGWQSDAGGWGTAWREHLERCYACPEVLARGLEHVARGAVIHLVIRRGRVWARLRLQPEPRPGPVYGVELDIAVLPGPRWQALRELCARRGWLRWEIVGQPAEAFRKAAAAGGLLPSPAEISFRCACLDRRFPICEHAAAALYGVGVRLDEAPEELFELRAANLRAVPNAGVRGLPAPAPGKTLALDAEGLADLFGVEVEPEPEPEADLAALEALRLAEDHNPKRPPRTLFGGP